MKLALRPLVLAGLLASAGLSAMAQTPPPPTAGQAAPAAGERKGPPPRGERFDPAARQKRIDGHFAQLKEKLRITPQQEGAWATFMAGTRPVVGERGGKPPFDRAAFAQLTTPQRIDRMREMRAKHLADSDRRADAVKAFYATLTPEQQKTFDQMPPHFGHFGHGGPGGERGWHGHGPHRGEGRPGTPPDAPPAPR